jgi:hypothetical protein
VRRRIFKQKKGFANLSLGLNYHSKALPQPPSRDTVPLRYILLQNYENFVDIHKTAFTVVKQLSAECYVT